ncbi:TIGR04104 family putative zinc finger protein [Oceanobacillus sp. CAU 1775]
MMEEIQLQKCGKCNTAFTWGQLYASFWLAFKPISCKNCGTTHEVTNGGRFRFIVLTVIPFLIIYNFISETSSIYLILGIAVIIIFLLSFFTPYIIPYKVDNIKESKDKPEWKK